MSELRSWSVQVALLFGLTIAISSIECNWQTKKNAHSSPKVFQVEKRRVRRSAPGEEQFIIVPEKTLEELSPDTEQKIIDAIDFTNRFSDRPSENEKDVYFHPDVSKRILDDDASLLNRNLENVLKANRAPYLEQEEGDENIEIPRLEYNPERENDFNDFENDYKIYNLDGLAKRVPILQFNVQPRLLKMEDEPVQDESIFLPIMTSRKRNAVKRAKEVPDELIRDNEEQTINDLYDFLLTEEALKDILASNMFPEALRPTSNYFPTLGEDLPDQTNDNEIEDNFIPPNADSVDNRISPSKDIYDERRRKRSDEEFDDKPLRYSVVKHGDRSGIFIPLNQEKAKVLLTEITKREETDALMKKRSIQKRSANEHRLDEKIIALAQQLAENDYTNTERK